ncbi:hypothetical protein [Lamprocystis purpurea]|jgi:hypothetical protein|uniref:hypothetical protein n=1 Tax=Lamprocystis purpurea TaxID=61598 RepID=UPI00036319D2|nr:hypothetical protein [Lamprocystis purpurea]
MKTRTARKRQRREVTVTPGPEVVSFRFGYTSLPPPTPADLEADQAAVAADRAWFERNRSALSFRRAPLGSEFRYAIPAGCVLEAVEVFQVEPGMRGRVPIFRRLLAAEIN